MKTNRLVLISYVIVIATRANAQQSLWIGGGVDAHGVRHRDSAEAKAPVWMNDLIYKIPPEYSVTDRASRHEGTALLRLNLDLKSGSVITAELVKSTGFPSLDHSALAATRRWRWKPNRWKEIDLATTFFLGSHSRMTIGPRP